MMTQPKEARPSLEHGGTILRQPDFFSLKAFSRKEQVGLPRDYGEWQRPRHTPTRKRHLEPDSGLAGEPSS